MPIIQVPSTLGVGVMVLSGAGSPEGVHTAGLASLYLQTDATAGNTLWKKTTATGNTGWTLIINGAATQSGSGSPEGSVSASVGTTYADTSSGAFWRKLTGVGNTGWQATDGYRTLLFSDTPVFDFRDVVCIRLGDLAANVVSQTWQNAGRLPVTVIYRQDGTGGRTVPAPSNALGFGTVSTGPLTISSQTFFYDTGISKFIAIGPMTTGM